jgi:hypothetical protein
MGDLSYFEKGQIVDAVSSVTKTATLLGVSRATVCKVLSAAYTNHGKTASVKRNSVGKN